MRQFFKFTFFKFVLTLILSFLPLLTGFLYSRSAVLNEKGFKIEPTWGMKTLYSVSEILSAPLSPLQNFFVKLGKTTENPYFFLVYVLPFVYIPFHLAYFYLLSCFASFLVNKFNKFVERGDKKKSIKN